MAATLENIQTQIEAIQGNLSTQTTKLNNHLADVDNSITNINTKIKLLNNEDLKIHQEVHDLASDVETNDTRLQRIEVQDLQGQIDSVRDSIDEDIQKQMEEMDLEHHIELHLLANGKEEIEWNEQIDSHTDKLNKLELKGAEIPEHIFVSESDYEKIHPESDKFYFTYEEE